MTHHVELVLPETHYLVRMLSGRIDTQGTVEELRSRGDPDHNIFKERAVVSDAPAEGLNGPSDAKVSREVNKPIKDEARECGAVKWSDCKTYWKAA